MISLPLESPVLVVTVSVAAFLVAPLLSRSAGIPGTVGVLVAGILLGPHGLHVLERSETIVLLGTVGLLYLMFVAALEVDMGGLAEDPVRSLVFGAVSFGVPLAAGTATGVLALGHGAATALLFAAVFSSHTILAYPVIERLGLARSRSVTTAVSATLVTDTAALLVLAWVTGAHGTGTSEIDLVRLLGGITLLALACWFLVPRLAQWFFRRLDTESYFEFLFALTVLLVASALAELAGIEPLVGAFLGGLGLNRRVTTPSTLQNRIDFAGNALFIPFFLFSVGMLVDPAAFVGGTRAWLVGGLLIALVLASKFAAAWATGTAYGFDAVEIRTVFGLTVGQAAAALAITLVGFDRGLFTAADVNGVVIMVAVMAVVSPVLAERFGDDLAHRERERRIAGGGPQRILVPLLGDESYREALVGLAILLRDPTSEEPLRLVHVIQRPSGPDDEPRAGEDGEDGVERALVEAEALLDEIEEIGAGAEVEMDTQTRVDEDRVRGILRAVEDNRITTIVTEWRNPSPYSSHFLGPPAHDLVARSDELLAAARLPDPLEAVDRVVAAVPSSLAAHPGTPEALDAVRGLASRVDAPQLYLSVGGEGGKLEALLERIPPEAPFEVVDLPRRALRGGFPPSDLPDEAALEDADLLVVVLPRPGGRDWSEEFREIPALTGPPDARNAVLLFLSEEPGRYRVRRFLRFT